MMKRLVTVVKRPVILFGQPFGRGFGHHAAMTIGQRIAAARKARKWSQRELARRADLAPGTIQKLEADGTLTPTTRIVEAVAKVLDIPVENLLREIPPQGDPEMRRQQEQLAAIISELTPMMRMVLLQHAKTLLDAQSAAMTALDDATSSPNAAAPPFPPSEKH